jgi:N6-adenosine-specific RNA methylase IME4/ParB-like chromosome segregation protein Spo0J
MNKIKITDLKPHPQNPRLVMREDVIEGIKARLSDGFHESHAIAVWKSGEDLLILSGHHRVEAAKRAGIDEVPAFIRDDLDEEGAYMELLTANSQGELSPLEVGMHALHYVAKAKGGRGKKGGLSEYAVRVGRDGGLLTHYRNAAEVAQTLDSSQEFLDKAKHLAAIHKLPKECWAECAQFILSAGLSAKDTQDRVKEAGDVPMIGPGGDELCPRHIAGVFTGSTTKREIARISEIIERVYSALQSDEAISAWTAYADTLPIDIKEVQSKRIEVENMDAELREKTETEIPSALPNLILADPPWRYDFAETDNRQIENQYPSATVDEIIGMLPEIQPDCVLFLWATVAKLREAFDVLDGWGFEYKTHAVWDKEKIGMGYWFRGQHELLIVATKGKFSPPEQENRRSSVFREARGKHSQKPECVYKWIEESFPDANKLEMFCRSPRDGWETFGNESKKS